MPQQARKGAVKAWVGFALPGDAVGRQRGAIRAYQDSGMTDNLLDVRLVHGGDEDTCVPTISDDIIAHPIEGVAATLTGHLPHGLPSVLRLVGRDGDTYRIP